MSLFQNPPDDLCQAAVNLTAAEVSYREKFFQAWDSQVWPKISKKRFFEILPSYREKVAAQGLYQRHSGWAAEEFIRESRFGAGVDFSFEEAAAFARRWARLSGYYHKKLFYVVEGYSDDGYGDLCDNLPLLGVDFYRCVKRAELHTHQRFAREVGEVINCLVGDGTRYRWWENHIFNGENYHGMHLRDAVKNGLVHFLRELSRA